MIISIKQRRLAGVITAIISLFFYSAVIAEPVSINQSQIAAKTFLKVQGTRRGKEITLLSLPKSQTIPVRELTTGRLKEILDNDGTVLAYVTELEPHGFIATSVDTNINPIIAYSFNNSFPRDGDKKNPLYRLLKEDMKLRMKALAEYDRFESNENRDLWDLYTDEETDQPVSQTFQQWPQENTTSTGGWLESVWDQRSPYNDFCPLDPVDANRAVVGCVATGMAQVINFHRQSNVSFGEEDAYITSSGISIDKDSELYDFPSFDELNKHLENLRFKYSRQIEPNDTDVAALSFACGITALMDYTSEGSGASPYKARDALLNKFGFYSADMTGGLSHEFNGVLQDNMINRLPVLLAISPTDGYGGHVVVCDGYNTKGEYHLNFGWGSEHPEEMTEVWYSLPSNLPSDLNIVTEVILNIQAVPSTIEPDPKSLTFYSIPGGESDPETLFIKNNTAAQVFVDSISSSDGFLISSSDDEYTDYIDSFEVPRSGQEASIKVKFCPQEAGGYYGTLMINYSQGNSKSVILNGHSFSGGTEIEEGDVFGTWTNSNSPYFISGNIEIPENEELIIEPGVEVLFVGPYSMTIGKNARLVAVGDENNPIEFTTLHKDLGWGGLRFLDSGDDDKLFHCLISYAKKGIGLITSFYYYQEEEAKDSCGGAIFCYASNPTITNCKITNNTGDKGGAIYCLESYPIISNTLIANNSSLGNAPQCGGICTEGWGAPEIINCTIVNNMPGGIFTASGDGIDMTNTIVWGNERYQIQTDESVPVVSFCNVQGGYTGEGNIDADPCFFDPSLGVGTEYDGASANWTLHSSSPCINSGVEGYLTETDLAGSPRIYSDLVDMGAYENQSDLPLITISPAGTLDAGFSGLNKESTIMLDISNTGKMDLQIFDLSISDMNGVFSIVNGLQDHLLMPGDTAQVEIGFLPTEERSYTSSVFINSNGNTPKREITIKGFGVSGTIIDGGEVSGRWKKEESPYTITGDITIPRGRTLTIEPGVVVKFAGHFGLTVGYRATLDAQGTETENIIFTAIDTEEGWYGLRFINSGADDILEYCTIEDVNKPYSSGSSYFDLLGGGILCISSWEAEPSYGVPSSPTIAHCLIANNYAYFGGGILCADGSEAVIKNNTIVDNSAFLDGGGICIIEASPEITNNVIAHNSGLDCGGIINMYGTPSIINNTIVHNRPNGMYLMPTQFFFFSSGDGQPVLNNIIWQNEIYLSYGVSENDYDIRFNNIQGNWKIEDEEQEDNGNVEDDESGNISIDPCFADPDNRDYHLKSQAGRWDPISQSWVQDDITSPCIDTGDPDTDIGEEPSSNGDIINMGAYGGTSQASKSN